MVITKLDKAIIDIVINNPFISSIMLNLKLVESNLSMGTASTDSVNIYYDSSFIESLKQDEVSAVIVHEVLHVVLLHHFRLGKRDPETWNAACDYVINNIVRNQYTLPTGALYDQKYSKMSEEEIYEHLLKNKKPSNAKTGGKVAYSMSNDIIPYDGKSSTMQEEKIKGLVASAIATEQQFGRNSGSISSLFPRMFELMEEKINWKEVLSRFINQSAKDDYNWKLPKPRYIHSGLYLPVQYSERLSDIVIMIDTSGSININMFNEFMSSLS